MIHQRWYGATGRLVPAIAVEGSIDLEGALVFDAVSDVAALRAAHDEGTPVVVRASNAAGVLAALARPEVACVLVTDPELLDLDLVALTYG